MPNLNQHASGRRGATSLTSSRRGRSLARTLLILAAGIALLVVFAWTLPRLSAAVAGTGSYYAGPTASRMTIPAAASNIVLVTSQPALNANDSVGWNGLGADGSSVPAMFSATSTLGKSIGGKLNGNGQVSNTRIWTKQNGPMTLTFPAVSGVGTFIVNSVNPGTQFTASLAVYNGTTFLGTVTRQSNTNGAPIYLGATDTTGPNITSAVYSLTVAGTIIAPDGTYTYHDFDCFGGNIDPFFCSSLSPSDPLDVDTILQCPQTTLCTEGFNLPPQPWISSTPNYPNWTGTETNYSHTPDTNSSNLADFYIASVDFAGPSAAPAINVKGNGMTIANGSTIPSTANDTDFGSTSVGAMVTKTFTIENTGTANLNLTGTPNKVVLSGSTDFSVMTHPTSPVAPSGMTTFAVKFAPTATGLKTATVSIANDDSTKNPYTFAIQGGGCDGAPIVQNTNDSGAGSLRQAILDACPGSTITFASPYFDAARTITLTSGQLVLNKNLTIQGTGASKLTISGNNASRVFQINSGVTAGISGLTVTGGNGIGALASGDGGGIYLEGSLTLTGVSVTNNTVAKFGGGIEISSGTLNLISSTVTNNTAQSGFGGGIDSFNNATLNLTGSTVSGNTANCATNNSNGGGGIWNQGALTITNSTISGNTATGTKGFGGGIRHTSGTLTITGSTVSGNTAQGAYTGGGIENDATLMMTNCTVSGNHADNVGTNNGGGILNYGGPATITASTITGNTAAGVRSAGGLRSDNGKTVTVSNTIIAGNTGTSSATPDVNNTSPFGGTFTSQGYNLIGDGTGATGFTGTADQVGTSGSPINALLGALADNGGPTKTHTLLPGSPAIDKGKAFGLSTDQRGELRPKDNPNVSPATNGDNSDIGAFEVQNTPPTISGNTITITAGSNTASFIIATTADPDQTVNTLGITINGNPTTATSNGVTVSGVTINANGNVIANVATTCAAATATFALVVTDEQSATGGGTLTVNVTANTPPSVGYNAQSFPAGTTPSFGLASSADNGVISSFALQSITPSSGLALNVSNMTGAVMVTGATIAQPYTVMIRATDNCGAPADVTFTVNVLCPNAALTPATLPNGVQGTPYNKLVTALPSGTTYSYAVTTNALPPGLSLNSATGALTGTPSAPGNYAFVITATGWGTCAIAQNYNLFITGTCSPITLNLTSLPTATLGMAYNQTVTATGDTAPYTFSVTNGALPPGLSLSSGGALTGTPATGGLYNFRITATGVGGCTGSRNYVVAVACAVLTVNPPDPTLPSGTKGQPYNQTLTITPTGTYTFSILLGQLPFGYTMSSAGVISGITNQTGTFNFTIKALGGTCQTTKSYTLAVNGGNVAIALTGDYDGDGKSDPALWSAHDGIWQILQSSNQQTSKQAWGTVGDSSLLGDYDGDGKSDLAVFRPSNATFYIKRSSDGQFNIKQWGLSTDVPVPGDYDGDGQTDIAVWRGATGTWHILHSSDGQVEAQDWGSAAAPYNDVPVTGDFDGDGKSDVAVFRRTTGTWLVKRSSDGQYLVKQWGLSTDVPVANDYDGDGKTDIAVWRGATGTWYIWQSGSDSYRTETWGAANGPYHDQAVLGDFDGDGQADLTVWRASTSTWLVKCSTDGAVLSKAHGKSSDGPVAARP